MTRRAGRCPGRPLRSVGINPSTGTSSGWWASSRRSRKAAVGRQPDTEGLMQAIVLAGGKGTRLRPFTHVFPKPLMPLGDADPMPILEVVLRQLGRFGFRDVTIITGYLTELIEAFCGNGRRFGVRVDYRREVSPMGTA